HDATYQKRGGENADVLVSKFAVNETVKLPIAHRHRRTGRTMLYVCQQMTQGIADLPQPQSEELLEALFQHLYSPEEKVFAHHCRTGALVLGDTLALHPARPNVSLEGPTRPLRKAFAPPPSQRTNKPQHSLVGGQ